MKVLSPSEKNESKIIAQDLHYKSYNLTKRLHNSIAYHAV